MKRQLNEMEKKVSEINLERMKTEFEVLQYQEKQLKFNFEESFPMEQKVATKKLADLTNNILPNARKQIEILEDQIKNGVEEIEKKEV